MTACGCCPAAAGGTLPIRTSRLEPANSSKTAAVSLAGRQASALLVRSEAEELEQAGGGDTVGVADADDPAGKLLPAGEVIRFGAAQAQHAGGGHQVDGGGGAELRDGDGCHGSLLGSRALVGKSESGFWD